MMFSIKDFFSKCDQIRRKLGKKLQIWSHLLKKSLIDNFAFCAGVKVLRFILAIIDGHIYLDAEGDLLALPVEFVGVKDGHNFAAIFDVLQTFLLSLRANRKVIISNKYHIYQLRNSCRKTQSRTLTFKKFFAKLKFSPALFEKKPSFVCLVFKI